MDGLMLMMPWAPLPAGTLVGCNAVCTEMVNCGTTASTVNVSGCEVAEPVESVPVTVTL